MGLLAQSIPFYYVGPYSQKTTPSCHDRAFPFFVVFNINQYGGSSASCSFPKIPIPNHHLTPKKPYPCLFLSLGPPSLRRRFKLLDCILGYAHALDVSMCRVPLVLLGIRCSYLWILICCQWKFL